MGGDEFTIVVSGLEDAYLAQQIAGKLKQSVEAPIRLAGGQTVDVGISVGVRVIQEPGSADEVLAAADHAMYQVKQQHRAVR